MNTSCLNIINVMANNYPLGSESLTRVLDDAVHWQANAAQLSPVQSTGNGSNYSIFDPFRFDPRCFSGFYDAENIPVETAERMIRAFTDSCNERKIIPIYDLVVGHVSDKSPLISSKKDWFQYDCNGNIVYQSCPSMVYGDIVKFDFSSRNTELFEYIYSIVEYFIGLGFRGFRCDFASWIDPSLYAYIIHRTNIEHPGVFFIAESFGCAEAEIRSLAEQKFDYYFNSSMWWDGKSYWCRDQTNAYAAFGYTGSVGILSNHDQKRLVNHYGSVDVVTSQIKLLTYLNSSVSITAGDHIGCLLDYNVFTSKPFDLESPPCVHDFRPVLAEANAIKASHPALFAETFEFCCPTPYTTVITKRTADGLHTSDVLVNRTPRGRSVSWKGTTYNLDPFAVEVA